MHSFFCAWNNFAFVIKIHFSYCSDCGGFQIVSGDKKQTGDMPHVSGKTAETPAELEIALIYRSKYRHDIMTFIINYINTS